MAHPGPSGGSQLLHSELAGIVGVLYTLTFWPPQMALPTFWLACDGLSLVSRLSASWPIDYTKPHADLLVAAWGLIITCGYQIELVFVQGHQDTGQPTVLTRDTWLNVEADLLAKQKVSISHKGPLFYKLPDNQWSCYTDTQCVVKQFTLTIWTFVNGRDCLEY